MGRGPPNRPRFEKVEKIFGPRLQTGNRLINCYPVGNMPKDGNLD